MRKNITIKDIAREAGVSTGTVDRVIHNRGNVSTTKKKIIKDIMDRLGYEPNLIASALALNKRFYIAILLPDPEIDPYWKDPLSGVNKALKSVMHYGITSEIYLFDLFDSSSFTRLSQQLLKTNPDAILFAPLFNRESNVLIKMASKQGVPYVMINTNIKQSNALSFIGPDSYQSGVLAGRLLNYHREKDASVIILNLSSDSTNAQHLIEKVEGFKSYYINAQMTNTEVVKYDFGEFDNDKLMQEFIQRVILRHPNVVGIFVTNSRVFRVVENLNDYQLKKIKIVGFDLLEKNIEYLKSEKIDFLINQNSIQQGYQGVMTLFNHYYLKQDVSKNQFLPLDIVVKENYSYYTLK